MARHIALMRHAQAEAPWGMSDFDRELSAIGHGQATAAGDWFVKNFRPNAVLCSSALRTRQTYMWVAERLGEQAPTAKLEKGLYHADEEGIISHIANLPDSVDKILVVAHYPGIQRSSIALSGRHSDTESLSQACNGFEPASIAVVEHQLSGKELQESYRSGAIPTSSQQRMPKMVDYVSGSKFIGS